jgi:fucose permease
MFVLTGVTNTLLGPLLPVLAEWWELDDARAGLLFTFQFTGSMAGSALCGIVIRAIGLRRTVLAGVLVMASGVGALGFGAVALGYAAVWWYGAGLGLTIPATNLLVAEAAPDSRAAALSLLNLSWGIGAISGPPALVLSRGLRDADVFLFALAGALLMTAAILAVRPAPIATAGAKPEQEHQTREIPPALRSRVAHFGAFLFVYVGTETSLSGWAAVYAQRVELLAAAMAIAAPSVFWGALLAGRGVAPLLLRRWSDSTLLTSGLLAATAGVAALLIAPSAVMLAVTLAAMGLGLSVVFPMSFAIFTRQMDRAAARAAAPVFVLAALGGATLPWLVGVASSRTGNIQAGLIVPLAGCVALLALNATRAR